MGVGLSSLLFATSKGKELVSTSTTASTSLEYESIFVKIDIFVETYKLFLTTSPLNPKIFQRYDDALKKKKRIIESLSNNE